MKRRVFLFLYSVCAAFLFFYSSSCFGACTVVITSNPPDSAVCSGGTITLHATTSGTCSISSIDWDSTGIPFSSHADSITRTLLNFGSSPIVIVYKVVVNLSGPSTTTDSIVVTVNPQVNGPTLATHTPNVTDICQGQIVSATFNPGSGGSCSDDFVSVIDGGSPQPYLAANNIGGSATSSIIIRGRRSGCPCSSASYTDLFTWTVHPQPVAKTITGNPPAGSTVCEGQNISATFSGGSNGAGTVTDVFEFSVNSGGTWSTYTPGNNILAAPSLIGTNTIRIRTQKVAIGPNGCNSTSYNVGMWSVIAKPAKPEITDYGIDSVCKNANGISFGLLNPDGAAAYQWQISPSASTTIHNDTSAFCAIDFPSSITTYSIIVTTSVSGCSNKDTLKIGVRNELAPESPELYLFTPSNIIVCLNNTFDSYQWGYDNGLNRFEPVTLSGEIYQDLVVGSAFDTTEHYYWVITQQGDCSTKTYFNRPQHRGQYEVKESYNDLDIELAPNPAINYFSATFTGLYTGKINMSVYDEMGREVIEQEFSKEDIFMDHVVTLGNNNSGIYFVRILYNQGDQKIFKIMIDR